MPLNLIWGTKRDLISVLKKIMNTRLNATLIDG
jgi:hypothetical protein